MKHPTDEEIEKAAIHAFQICRGESIHTWTMSDDDPEADYWRQIWGKGAKWARDQQQAEIDRLKKALEDIQMASLDYSNLSSWGNLAGMLDKINSNASDALKP